MEQGFAFARFLFPSPRCRTSSNSFFLVQGRMEVLPTSFRNIFEGMANFCPWPKLVIQTAAHLTSLQTLNRLLEDLIELSDRRIVDQVRDFPRAASSFKV